MKTALITSDTYQNHNTGEGHPEQINRVSIILDNFKKIDNKNLIWKKPSKVKNKILEITHSLNYVKFVQNSFPKKGLSFLDGDTIISPGCKEALIIEPKTPSDEGTGIVSPPVPPVLPFPP